MLESITNTLQQVSGSSLGLLLAFALGVVGVAAHACCALPTLGVMISYSGAQENATKKLAFKKALFFTLGTVVSLMIIGGIAGFVGHAANITLGRYWKIFAGAVLIFFGLATLKFLPFRMSFRKFDGLKNRLAMSGAMTTGFILGGLVAVSSLCCNPALFTVISVAMLQKHILQAVLLFGMFAIGFSVPIGAILFGVSLGKASFLSKSADIIIRWIAGAIQLVVGFYFLITF